MTTELPTQQDFGASPNDPDATEAWQALVGKTVDEVFAEFVKFPLTPAKHFLAMGERAFCFYFPALDRYMRSLSPVPEDEPYSAIARRLCSTDCISIHFDRATEKLPLHDAVVALCDYVNSHVDHFEIPLLQDTVAAAWAALRRKVLEDAELPQSARPRLKIPEGLPTRLDFGRGLDARSAWETFGGKTLEEAYELFCAVPDSYGEKLMWMGEQAFRFYYPVIDRYLRSLAPLADDGSFDYTPAWFLACSIRMHFDCHEDMSGLHESILSLCDYVLSHLEYFDRESERQQQITTEWTALRQQVADDARGIRNPRS